MWTREWWPENARLARVFFVADASGKAECPGRDLGWALREVLERQAEADRPFLDDLPDLWDGEYSALTAQLVPRSGPADTIQGEVLRAALRVTAEFNSSGCGNWQGDPAFFDEFVAFLLTHLCDGTFGNDAAAFVRDLLGRLRTFGNCDYDLRSRDEELALGKLIGTINQFALAWCVRHPDLIPRHRPDGEDG